MRRLLVVNRTGISVTQPTGILFFTFYADYVFIPVVILIR